MIHLDAARLLLVAGAALIAGAVNAVAGGGTLVSFPALLLLGFPAVTANVTNTIGLLPGYAGGSVAYRAELSVQRERVRFLAPISIAGAVVGAILLTRTSNHVFVAIVPWLILAACALLMLQPVITTRLHTRRVEREQHRSPVLVLTQFLSGVYGAFFGAGLGVMMLALLGLFIRDDLQRINALKGVLSLIINVVAAVYLRSWARVVDRGPGDGADECSRWAYRRRTGAALATGGAALGGGYLRHCLRAAPAPVVIELGQASLRSPAGQLMSRRELQLTKHRRDVALHGLRGDEQLAGDLLVGEAPGDQPEHLALARRELVELRIETRGAPGRQRAAPRIASRTKPASRGENTASPAATRQTASTRSAPEIVLVT